jgi:uracil phosphoribosyltransferase
MNRVILKAEDLDGYLTDTDKDYISRMDGLYKEAMAGFNMLSVSLPENRRKKEADKLIQLYNEMGSAMQDIC